MYFVSHHLLQNSFFPQNNQHQMFLIFFSTLSRSKSFDLFLVTLSLMAYNLASKSGFLTKCVCAANLALKTSAAIVLNSGVASYLS